MSAKSKAATIRKASAAKKTAKTKSGGLNKAKSRSVGETAKKLPTAASAEKREGVFFFDEADALFGKRTSVGDAHDRYANQEVSALKKTATIKKK